MPAKRYGVMMSSLKARVVDLIASGGDEGILIETVWQRVFQPRQASRDTMKAHVWQINQMLADAGYRITRRNSVTPTYHIVQSRRRAAA
jgi:hypothetical protein